MQSWYGWPGGTAYADAFISAYQSLTGGPPPVAEWRFNVFGYNDTPQDVMAWFSRAHEAAAWAAGRGVPLVLNIGFHGWVDQHGEHVTVTELRQAMALLRIETRVAQVAWWAYESWASDPLADPSGTTLTAMGQEYVSTSSPPALTGLTVYGNSQVHPGLGCSWQVDVQSGTAPYQYLWRVNGRRVGDLAASGYYINNGNPFTIEVIVLDANGRVGTASMNVGISSGAYCQ